MPGRHCAVAACKNNSVATKLNNESIVFHRFPQNKDTVSKTIREKWVRLCGRADKFNPDTSQICSVHFETDDYVRDLRNELLGLPTRRKLKKTAIPSLHLKAREKNSDSAVKRNKPASVRPQKLEVKNKAEISSMEHGALAETEEESNLHWKEKYGCLLANYKKLEKKYEQSQRALLALRKKSCSQVIYYKIKRPSKRQSSQNQINLIHKKNVNE